MIGTKYFQKKARVQFFITMYGLLALAGAAIIGISLYRNQDPLGAAGFMLVFGAGMSYLTWAKSKKARVAIREDFLELNQQRRTQFVRYKSISKVTMTKDNRLVLAVREGHDINQVTIWLKDLEEADAKKLSEFCLKKGWKGK